MKFTRTEIRNIYEDEFIGHREIVNELCDELDAKDALIAKYETVLRIFHEDYDCDADAHRYGALCRCCEAERVLRKGESE